MDADERGQLQVLRTATEPNAPLYAAAVSILAEAKLAAEGDDSAGLFVDRDLGDVWRGRWTGLTSWFQAGTDGTAADADDLEAATTGAIRDLMAFLRKLTESATRPITRASSDPAKNYQPLQEDLVSTLS